MDKFIKIFKIVIGVLGGILYIRIVATGDQMIEDDVNLQTSILSPLIYLSYVILALCVLATVGFVIKGLFQGEVKKNTNFIRRFCSDSGCIILCI